MLQIEIKLLKSKKFILPAAILMLAMLFTSFLYYWVGSKQKELEGAALAAFVSVRGMQSTTLALFFLFWMLQFTIHLQNTGFYKMLLLFGWQRNKIFVYNLFQIGIYAVLLMLLNYLCFALFSFFYGTNPFQLIFNSDINGLLSQYFYLFAIGLFGVVVGSVWSNYILILPFFIYWLFEGWLNSLLNKRFELSLGEKFPLQSIHQIISENLLNFSQILTIGIYVSLFFMLLHLSIQKKMFV